MIQAKDPKDFCINYSKKLSLNVLQAVKKMPVIFHMPRNGWYSLRCV
jgi:hypothetical protein